MLGTRKAALALAETESNEFINNVETAISKLDRTRFPTLNSVISGVETATGSKEEIQARIAIRSFVGAYARVLKPTGGVIGVTDMANASHLLEQNWSKGQMQAAIGQFRTELKSAKTAADEAVRQFENSGNWNIPKNASLPEAMRIIAGMETPSGRAQETGGGGGGGGGGAGTPPSAGAPADPLGIR
jgi:hypothetical protein